MGGHIWVDSSSQRSQAICKHATVLRRLRSHRLDRRNGLTGSMYAPIGARIKPLVGVWCMDSQPLHVYLNCWLQNQVQFLMPPCVGFAAEAHVIACRLCIRPQAAVIHVHGV